MAELGQGRRVRVSVAPVRVREIDFVGDAAQDLGQPLSLGLYRFQQPPNLLFGRTAPAVVAEREHDAVDAPAGVTKPLSSEVERKLAAIREHQCNGRALPVGQRTGGEHALDEVR